MANNDDWKISELLDSAIILPDEDIDYANNVRINVAVNEVTLDFYHITPSIKPSEVQPSVLHIQRIVLPVGVAKEVGDLLVESVNQQKTSGASQMAVTNESAKIWAESREQAWNELDELWAKWDSQGDRADDLETDWLEELRAGSDRRLNELYDAESR